MTLKLAYIDDLSARLRPDRYIKERHMGWPRNVLKFEWHYQVSPNRRLLGAIKVYPSRFYHGQGVCGYSQRLYTKTIILMSN